jgi:hypothetical protein
MGREKSRPFFLVGIEPRPRSRICLVTPGLLGPFKKTSRYETSTCFVAYNPVSAPVIPITSCGCDFGRRSFGGVSANLSATKCCSQTLNNGTLCATMRNH